MQNIVVVPVEYEDQFIWCVFEHATEQVIKGFFFEDDAQEYANFCRKGGAFDGFTPAFMTVEVPLKDNINTAFGYRT